MDICAVEDTVCDNKSDTTETAEEGSDCIYTMQENEESHESCIDNQQHTCRSTEANFEDVPIDRGWAWAVLAGCVLYTAIAGGINRSFGVFFLQFQERFQAKAGEVAVMGLIQNITISITGLVTMTVGVKRLSCRTLVAIGGGLNALAHIISGVTRDIRVFYFSHGLLGGMGIVLAGPTMISTIGVYFSKHRGLANSIVAGSASVGGLMFAPVFTKLFEEYGYAGTMIIVSGFLLNTFVTASLMRPPSWFSKQHKIARKGEVLKKLFMETSETDSTQYTHKPINELDQEQLVCKESIVQPDCAQNLQAHSDNATTCEENYSESNRTKCKLCSSCGTVQSHAGAKHAYRTENGHTCLASLKATLAEIIKTFDVSLLKDMRCILYLLMAFFTVSGLTLVPLYLPPFAKDTGMTYSDISAMVSATACMEFVSKILSGVIADRQWMSRCSILALGAFATGTLCHFTRFYIGRALVMTSAVMMSCFYGWYMSMYAPILVDCVGLKRFQSCLGFLCIVHGVSAATFFPLCGLLRDITGSYIYSLHLAGGLCYAGAALLLLMSVIQKKYKFRNITTKDEADLQLTASNN